MILVTLATAGHRSWRHPVLTAGWVALLTAGMSRLPITWVGIVASCLSASMFIPQAWKLWHSRHTPAARGYSPRAALLVVTANLLWLTYGILLADVWLTWPNFFHVASGALMLYIGLTARKRPPIRCDTSP